MTFLLFNNPISLGVKLALPSLLDGMYCVSICTLYTEHTYDLITLFENKSRQFFPVMMNDIAPKFFRKGFSLKLARYAPMNPAKTWKIDITLLAPSQSGAHIMSLQWRVHNRIQKQHKTSCLCKDFNPDLSQQPGSTCLSGRSKPSFKVDALYPLVIQVQIEQGTFNVKRIQIIHHCLLLNGKLSHIFSFAGTY